MQFTALLREVYDVAEPFAMTGITYATQVQIIAVRTNNLGVVIHNHAPVANAHVPLTLARLTGVELTAVTV